MNELLLSNIKKSLKIVAEENPKVPEHLIEVVEEEGNESEVPCLIEELVKIASQPIPWFYRNSSRGLQSPQQSFFGFYSVRNTLRGVLLGLRFIQAGDLLQENSFLSASIFSYYTASFHLLHSFLALNGRIIIDQVQGPIKIVKHKNSSESLSRSLDPTPEVIIAILTQHNTWKFEPRRRSHTRRWRELEPILAKLGNNTPDFFLSFFEYVLSYGRNPLSNSKTLVQEGLQRLTEIRHESIYGGYGFDDYVHNGIINRNLNSSYGIDHKSNAYRDFAIGFLTSSVNEVVELKNNIPNEYWDKIEVLLISSIFTPPFERGDLTLAGKPELTKTLKRIDSWLMKFLIE